MNDSPPDRVADFRPLRAWVADCGGEAFSTFSAAEWFIRRNRDRLLASGQFIVRKGSAGSLVGPRFDAVVLDILREESRREAAGVPVAGTGAAPAGNIPVMARI
ncbi:MAG: hypothetical protein KAX64_06315 [Chromatiaceae bacterium]|nr:hypothetical protein [Chromatiaceae bacterium]